MTLIDSLFAQRRDIDRELKILSPAIHAMTKKTYDGRTVKRATRLIEQREQIDQTISRLKAAAHE
jgi:hypothetical protein